MANFVSNDDALEVLDKYAKGIKKGIGVVAVRETSPAAAAHAVGDYIRYSGTVYKVKSAISIGDSLILNTNIEANDLPNDTTIYTPGLDEENFSEEISSIVNVYGSKNLLPNEGISTTSSGVTFTVNDDKSITINSDGTNASAVDFYLYNHNNGVHDDWSGAILSGISGGSNTTYQLIVQYRNPNMDWLYLDDGEANLPNINTFDSVRIRVYANTTLTNVTVNPMIRDARIKDSTYAPYAMTNRELTEAITKKTVIRAREVTYNTGIVPFNNVEKVMCIEFSDGSILVNGVITITNDWDADGVSEMIFQLPSGIDTSSAKLAKNIWVSFERVYASSGSPAEKLTGYFDTNNRFVRWGTTTKSGYVRGVYIINFSF